MSRQTQRLFLYKSCEAHLTIHQPTQKTNSNQNFQLKSWIFSFNLTKDPNFNLSLVRSSTQNLTLFLSTTFIANNEELNDKLWAQSLWVCVDCPKSIFESLFFSLHISVEWLVEWVFMGVWIQRGRWVVGWGLNKLGGGLAEVVRLEIFIKKKEQENNRVSECSRTSFQGVFVAYGKKIETLRS